jgi:CHAT domain-containing protein/tetratricopeptide (TPR) repeat protein
MKQLLPSFFFLCILSLPFSPLWAFQQLPTPLEKYGSLEKAMAVTEELAYAGEFSEAIELGKAVKNAYRQQKNKEQLSYLNQELLLYQVLRTDLTLPEKEEEIRLFYEDSRIKKDPNAEQVYQAALAHLMLYNGNFERFERYYQKAVTIANQQEDYKTLRHLNVNIATEYLFLAEWKEAVYYIEKAEEALSKEKNTPTAAELGSFHNARSVIYYNLSEYDKALNSALYNVRELESSQEDQTIALLYDYNNLAGIYKGLGEDENALLYHEKALEILPNTSAYPISEEAVLYYNISIAYDDNGQKNLASYYANKALNTLNRIPSDKHDREINTTFMSCYYNLINIFLSQQKLDSCDYYINKANKLLQYTPSLAADYYYQKSKIEVEKKNYKKALLYVNESLKQSLKTYGKKDIRTYDCYAIISRINSFNKQYDLLTINAQKALASVSIDFEYVDLYKNPAIQNVAHKKNAIVALVLKIQGLRGLYQQNKSPEIAQAIFSTTRFSTQVLEQLNKEFKNPATKRRWLQTQAIPLFETAIASALDIAKSTGDSQYLQEAFELSERSKSMLMTDMLQEQTAAQAGGVPDSLVNKLQDLKRALHVAEKKRFDAITTQESAAEQEAEDRIFEINQELDILKRHFEKAYPKYYKLKYDENQVSLAEIQKALEPGSMLLEFFEGNQTIYIFSVYKDRIEVASFERTADYNRLFTRFSNSLIDVESFIKNPVKVYNDFIKRSHQLYQALIAPVDLQGIQRIIIIPDGELSYLPFEVLLTKPITPVEDEQETMQANFKILPYLLRDFSTNYNYSGRLWLERNLLSKNAVNNRILALAPKYTGATMPEWRGKREVSLRKKLTDLPGAFDEVLHLKENYAGAFYSNYDANEAILKKEAANYGILHLAMHGLVNTKKPEFSGLALAEDQSQEEDNFLYAYEIEQLPIQTSLIVLSACETGIGQYQKGEGVVSIGRSFVYAGAPSLLMTLWNLNDQSGAFIIEEFYRNLNNGLEKDEAIRQAKLYYLKTYSQEFAHPFLWAAFIQVGSYESISIASKHQYWWFYIFIGAVLFFILLLFYKKRTKLA